MLFSVDFQGSTGHLDSLSKCSSLSYSVYFARVTNHYEINLKQGNRGDMWKIHVSRQFFESSSRHGDLIEKTKDLFLDKVNGSMCTKFQVCIVVSVARRRDTNKYINKYIHTHIYK